MEPLFRKAIVVADLHFGRSGNSPQANQDIRDDLLVMHGAMPSFTRQVDDEIEQRSESEVETKEPKRRGRKPKVQD